MTLNVRGDALLLLPISSSWDHCPANLLLDSVPGILWNLPLKWVPLILALAGFEPKISNLIGGLIIRHLGEERYMKRTVETQKNLKLNTYFSGSSWCSSVSS